MCSFTPQSSPVGNGAGGGRTGVRFVRFCTDVARVEGWANRFQGSWSEVGAIICRFGMGSILVFNRKPHFVKIYSIRVEKVKEVAADGCVASLIANTVWFGSHVFPTYVREESFSKPGYPYSIACLVQ